MPKFDPKTDISKLSGVTLITGGTAGTGAQTVTLLAAHNNSPIIFTGRSESRATALINHLKSLNPHAALTFIPMDLSSLASVQSCAKQILRTNTRLDTLILNAGIMAVPPSLTTDGYETQFGTNHLGHALFTKLLLPLMCSTAAQSDTDVRIILLSSLGFGMHPQGGIHFDTLKTPQDKFLLLGPWQRYGQSKLANILYAAELARRDGEKGILVLSIHPGTFNTGLVSNLRRRDRALIWASNGGRVKDEKREGEGAWNSCWAATVGRDEVVNGGFYVLPVGTKGRKMRQNEDVELAGRLWEWTERELEGWCSG